MDLNDIIPRHGRYRADHPAVILGDTAVTCPAAGFRRGSIHRRGRLLNHRNFTADRVGALKMILSLGAPLHLEHKTRLEQVLPGRFHELYGVTEGFVTILDHRDATRKPDSVGCPTPFFKVRIIDNAGNGLPPGQVGEICGSGPIAMAGYYKRPDLTAETVVNGWIRSSDLGYLDDDFLYLVDRKKDMIISGGVNVYPRDIEEVLVRHPEVTEVAVFGVTALTAGWRGAGTNPKGAVGPDLLPFFGQGLHRGPQQGQRHRRCAGFRPRFAAMMGKRGAAEGRIRQHPIGSMANVPMPGRQNLGDQLKTIIDGGRIGPRPVEPVPAGRIAFRRRRQGFRDQGIKGRIGAGRHPDLPGQISLFLPV